MDKTDRATARAGRALERKISAVYRDAAADLSGKVQSYLASFAGRQTAMKAQLDAGEITQEYYNAWLRNNIGRGARWQALRGEMARRATECNQIAAAYTNDTTPGIYTLNANRAMHQIEATGRNVDFALISERTIQNLVQGANQYEFQISDGAGGLTYRRLRPDIPADYAWNSQQIERQLTIGILAGDGIPQMAARFLSIMGKNETAAIRNARTAVTSAQNAGTLNTMLAAREMGIEVRKQWLSTADDRTRDSHVRMDGETVGIDDRFSNGLLYPGDPAGAPAEVYNCRCTMVYVLPPEAYAPPEQEQQNGTAPTQDDTAPQFAVDDMHPQTIAGVARTVEAMTFDEADSGATNPRYSDSIGYRNNCATCVVANEARRRGYDVIAKGRDTVGTVLDIASQRWEVAWIDPATGNHPTPLYNENVRTAKQAYTWLNDTVKTGERYVLRFTWRGSRNGHIINMDKTDGGVLRLQDNQLSGSYLKWASPTETGEKEIVEYLKQCQISGGMSRQLLISIDENGNRTAGGVGDWYPGLQIMRIDNKEFFPNFADRALESADVVKKEKSDSD